MRKTLIMLHLYYLLLLVLLKIILAENEEPTPTLYSDDNLFCTEEAKLCEDGSYVSRNSSNDCEFDACPDD